LDVFFGLWTPSTVLAHTRLAVIPLQFVPPTTDRVSAQACRPNHSLDSAAALLQRQQSYKSTPVFLVQGRQHAIDRSVLVRHSAIRMLLTLLTGTHMHTPSNRVFHDRSPYACSQVPN